jgi:hypothetical protein
MYLGSPNLGIINPNTFGGGLNPRILFINNEAGLSLDVETAYLRGWVYQDSAGATVAAAPGDTVGLILDTAKGALDALGNELVSNGTFATDTVWSKGANWTIGGGVATKTGGAANNLTQTISSTAGLWYRITIDVTRTAGTLTVSLGTSGTTRVINASGSYTFFVLAGSSTQTLTLAGDSAFAGTVDNVTSKLVPGNHAYQTTLGSRPLLARTPDGGRRNLIVNSEFSGSGTPTNWTAFSTGGTATIVTSTAGYSNAIEFVTASSGLRQIMIQGFTTLPNSTYTVSFQLEAVSGTTRSVASWGTTPAGSTLTSLIDPTTPGRYSITITTGATGGTAQVRLGIDVSGDLTATACTVRISGVQVELGTETAYQRVGLTSDVTESGKRDCWGLLFDGSDDSLQTASVDFSATDKMTVMTGVRKNSDVARGMLVELSASLGANTGTFLIAGPDFNLATDRWAAYIRGDGANQSYVETSAAYAAPVTNVLTMTGDLSLSVSEAVLRINSAVRGSTTAGDAGGGNFGNYPLYIGSRGGSTNRFNGLIYTLIVRGATTPTGTIENFERNLLALRCGVTF